MRALIAMMCLLSNMAFAKDYGVLGKTFVIEEMDFLEYIHQKINLMQRTGEWKKVQSDFKKRVKEHVMRPEPTYLPRATEDKTWFFDPSLTVPYNVRDAKGHVIVSEGTVINPLERVSLSSTLLLFNADDEAQCAFVEEELKTHSNVKLILTSGSVKDTANRLKQAIYFDLNGFLIKKFNITHVPARVVQDKMRLKIDEVSL